MNGARKKQRSNDLHTFKKIPEICALKGANGYDEDSEILLHLTDGG